jgi:hypothetical protein
MTDTATTKRDGSVYYNGNLIGRVYRGNNSNHGYWDYYRALVPTNVRKALGWNWTHAYSTDSKANAVSYLIRQWKRMEQAS